MLASTVYTCIISNGTGTDTGPSTCNTGSCTDILEIVAIKNASHSLCRKIECVLLALLDEFFVRTATTITEGPVSVTALIGTDAHFHGTGTGTVLRESVCTQLLSVLLLIVKA